MIIKMNKNKGFSLIELMIVVAIIGILSLMAIPVYSDYVTRVKLTEVALRHLYLNRQLEVEFGTGGVEAVFTYAKGACVSNLQATGDTFTCKTNIGLTPGLTMTTTYFPVNGSTQRERAEIRISPLVPQTSSSAEYNVQSFDFSSNVIAWRGDVSSLRHYPKVSNSNNLSSRPMYIFDFVRQRESDTGPKIEITNQDGTYFGDLNRWYCGGEMYELNKWVLIPKSIRPSMCKLARVRGGGGFIED